MKKDINYFLLGASILLLTITTYHILYGEISAFSNLKNMEMDDNSILINLYLPWHQLTLIFMTFVITLGIASFKKTFIAHAQLILVLLTIITAIYPILPFFGYGMHMFILTLPEFMLFLGLDVLIFLGLKRKNPKIRVQNSEAEKQK